MRNKNSLNLCKECLLIQDKIYNDFDMVNLFVGGKDGRGNNGLLVDVWLNHLGHVRGSVWPVHWDGVWLFREHKYTG